MTVGRVGIDQPEGKRKRHVVEDLTQSTFCGAISEASRKKWWYIGGLDPASARKHAIRLAPLFQPRSGVPVVVRRVP
jgi:hypothetical protein